MSVSTIAIIIVTLLFAGDFVFMFWMAKHFGFIRKIVPVIETAAPVWLAYLPHKGSYMDIAPVVENVSAFLRDQHQINPELGFGIYFDDPKQTPKDQLRSIGGFLISEEHAEFLKKRSDEIRIASLPETRAVVALFPLRAKFSYAIGATRVYPALAKYLQKEGLNDGPVMEVYDEANQTIRYLRPLDIPDSDLVNLL
jgi:DNA gyrase inhibitor GyrI